MSSTTFHMLKLWIDNRRLVELGKALHLPLRHADVHYLTHCALGEAFQDNAPTPFCVDTGNSQDRHFAIVAYSELGLDELRAISQAFASPMTYAIIDWERSAGKPMPTVFPEGMTLGFEIRSCPVVRLASKCGKYRKGSELDAYQAAMLRAEQRGADKTEKSAMTRESVYSDWLRTRLEGDHGGGAVERIALDRFALEKMLRRDHKPNRKAHRITRPVVTMSGDLTVSDPETFAQTLRQGVGRHRSFGFGMIKVRRSSAR